MNDHITIKLALNRAEHLSEILHTTQDEGCGGDGWASPELSELRSLVDDAIGQRATEDLRLGVYEGAILELKRMLIDAKNNRLNEDDNGLTYAWDGYIKGVQGAIYRLEMASEPKKGGR